MYRSKVKPTDEQCECSYCGRITINEAINVKLSL